jgi:hypothetical protein
LRLRFDDPDLIADYLGADLNRTGKLSFEELQAFQKKLVSRFCVYAERIRAQAG